MPAPYDLIIPWTTTNVVQDFNEQFYENLRWMKDRRQWTTWLLDSFSTTSASWVDIPDLSITFTPQVDKVLVYARIMSRCTDNGDRTDCNISVNSTTQFANAWSSLLFDSAALNVPFSYPANLVYVADVNKDQVNTITIQVSKLFGSNDVAQIDGNRSSWMWIREIT